MILDLLSILDLIRLPSSGEDLVDLSYNFWFDGPKESLSILELETHFPDL